MVITVIFGTFGMAIKPSPPSLMCPAAGQRCQAAERPIVARDQRIRLAVAREIGICRFTLEDFPIAGTRHVQKAAVPVLGRVPHTAGTAAHGGRFPEQGATLVRRRAASIDRPAAVFCEKAVQVRDFQLPFSEQAVSRGVTDGRQVPAGADRQSVVARQADIDLGKFERAGVQIHLIAEQVRSQ